MKNKLNRQSILSIFFICFVSIILFGTVGEIVIPYVSNHGIAINENLGQSVNNKVEITNNDIAIISNDTESSNNQTALKSIALKTYDILQNIDSRIYKRTNFINVYGLTQKITGNRRVYDVADSKNDVVKIDKGYLTFVWPKSNDLAPKAEKTALLYDYLKRKDINLLYIQLPDKINKWDNMLPTGVVEYSNENADTMLSELKSRDVSTFDLRDVIVKDGLDWHSLFFRTDHHWTPETGLWATGKIAEKLNIDYDFNIDMTLLDKNNFSTKVYKNCFLGSQGKRVGQYYAGVDDIDLLLPKYKSDISFTYLDYAGETKRKKDGSFENTLIFKEHLIDINYFETNTYCAYEGGGFPLEIFTNNELATKKILLIRDSFSCVVAPFLSLAVCKELRTIDPRYFTGSIIQYIEDFKPDIVLMLYSQTAVSDSKFFEF